MPPPSPPAAACCSLVLRSSGGVRSRPPPPTGWLAGLSEDAVRGVTCPQPTFPSLLNIAMDGHNRPPLAGTQSLRLRCLGSRTLHQHVNNLHRVVCRVHHKRDPLREGAPGGGARGLQRLAPCWARRWGASRGQLSSSTPAVQQDDVDTVIVSEWSIVSNRGPLHKHVCGNWLRLAVTCSANGIGHVVRDKTL